MNPHDPYTDTVGAYLLEALEDDERAAFEEHLAGCERCRRDVSRLSVARDALPRSVEQVAPSERLKASLMDAVRAEAQADPAPAKSSAVAATPRRSRWRGALLTRPGFAAAAASLVLALGIGMGVLVGVFGGGGDESRTVPAIVDQSRMPAGEASLVVADDGEGAQLRVEGMQPPPEGKVYEVWIKRGDRVLPSSLFTVERDGSGTAAIPEDLDEADAVVVTREPEGGSRSPSEPPVLTVPVSS